MKIKHSILFFILLVLLMITGCGKKEKAGLYSGDELVMTWDELIASGAITVNNGGVSSGFYENENGIGNTSSDVLAGRLVLDDSITSIIAPGFRFCTKLEEVQFSDHTISTDSYVFQNCTSLTKLVLSKNTKELGNFATEYCTSLKQIDVDKKNKYYKAKDGILFSKDMKVLCHFPCGCNISDYTIPDTVEHINEGAFSVCQNLQHINIPKSVEQIDHSAFWGCINLVAFHYAGSEEEWYQIQKGSDWNAYCKANIFFK